MEVTGYIYVLRSCSVLESGFFYPHGGPFEFISSGSLGFSPGLSGVTLPLSLVPPRLCPCSVSRLGPGLSHGHGPVRCSPVRIRMAPRFARRSGPWSILLRPIIDNIINN